MRMQKRRASSPQHSRQGPPGKVYGISTIKDLIQGAINSPVDLRPKEAYGVVKQYLNGGSVRRNTFEDLWKLRAEGQQMAFRTLEAINELRQANGKQLADSNNHIEEYTYYITCGNFPKQSEAFENLEIALDHDFSISSLKKFVLRKYLMPGIVANQISQAATAVNIPVSLPIDAGDKNLGKVPDAGTCNQIRKFLMRTHHSGFIF